ncbi:15760_t:CDS:2, partial [Cetraspora pellucida]
SQSESDKEGIEDSDSLTSERDEIPSGGRKKDKEKGQKKGKEKANNSYRHKKGARKENSEKDINDFNNIKYLLVADTDDFKWDNTGKERDVSLELLQIQYNSAKDFQTKDVHAQPTQQTASTHDSLECKESGSSSLTKENEVIHYIRYQQIGVDQDSLEWWNVNKNEFLVLLLLVLKYLSISTISVPSERLFSDAENYISAKCT